MHAILASAFERRRHLATFVVAVVALAGLAGCSGGADGSTPLAVTLSATDAPGTLARGQNAVFTVTLANPSSVDVPAMDLTTSSAGLAEQSVPPLDVTSVTCSAQGAICPTVSGAGTAGPFTLAAGGVLTFTVTSLVNINYDGTVDQQFSVSSLKRGGHVDAVGHVTLADARDGLYEIFAASGLRTNLDVSFKAGATKFAVSSGSVDNTMVQHQAGYVFPTSGLVFNNGPDILLGQADFGSGADTFIAARVLVTALSDLDGTTFSTFSVVHPVAGPPAGSVRAMAIAGSAMTVCADVAPHAIATCPAGSLRQYALTVDGPIFTATDSAGGDTFDFQVARSGGKLILLQADKRASGGVFAVGFSDAAITPTDLYAIGTFAGTLDAIALKADSFTVAPIDLNINASSTGPLAALAPIAGGPAGLVGGVRPSDSAALLFLQQAGVVVASGPAGEFDVLINAATR